MSYTKFEKPVRTEIKILVGWQEFSDVAILGETEKAYLIAYNKSAKDRNTGRFIDRTQWVPKSIWNDDKYFEPYRKGGMIFNRPNWLN